MKQRVSGSWRLGISLVVGAAATTLAMLSGCAEILGLEPPDVGGGGATGGTKTGGTGGTGGAMCVADVDCPPGGLPPCQKPVCVNGGCQSAPAANGEEIPCYDGDPSTVNVGVCKAGTQTCTDGIASGPCEGQVVPKEEVCELPQDEDCDGKIGVCSGGIIDVSLFSGTFANELHAVVLDLDDNLFVSGRYQGPAQIFDCDLEGVPMGYGAAFVAKLTPDLKCQWAIVMTTSGPGASDLAHLVLSGGRLWVEGTTTSPALLTDTTNTAYGVQGPGGYDVVLVALDPFNGKVYEVHTIGGPTDDYGVAIATAGSSVFALVQGLGGVTNSLVLGGTSVSYGPAAGGNFDVILASANAETGTMNWVRSFGSPSDDAPRSLGVLDDRLVIGGGMGLGGVGTTLPGCVDHSFAQPRAFLFDTDTSTGLQDPKVCQIWGGTGPSYALGLQGVGTTILAAGYSEGLTDIGCTTQGIAGYNAWFRRDTIAGGCVDGAILSGPTYGAGVRALSFDDDLIFGGSYNGPLFGGPEAEGRDIFVARYFSGKDPPIWHLEIGSIGDDDFADMAVSDSVIVAVGTCRGGSFGPFDCDGSGDGFLLRIAP